MGILPLMLVLAILSTGSALAQSDTQETASGEPSATTETLSLINADRFVDLEIRDSAGQRVGQLEYFMVDLDSGNLDYAVIGSGEGLDIGEELVAVPWATLSPEAGGESLRFDGSREKLQQGPRIAEQRLMDMTLPNVFSQIVDYYVAPRPVVDSEPMQAPTPPRHHSTQLLVGRRVVAVLSNDSTAPARRIEGARITARDGEDIGEIHEVMLDLDHGHIAYVTAQRLNQEPAPMPFGVLGWNEGSETFELLVDARLLGEFPSFTRPDGTMDIPLDNLRRLFEHYGVAPYWSG